MIENENLNNICAECKAGKRGCVGCKKELASALSEYLRPVREKRKYYEEHPEEVERILKEGTEAARNRAKNVMSRVRKNMKLDYF